jgi:hypothetical protein
MSNENTEYERFVRDVKQTPLEAQGLDTVDVRHNVQLI